MTERDAESALREEVRQLKEERSAYRAAWYDEKSRTETLIAALEATGRRKVPGYGPCWCLTDRSFVGHHEACINANASLRNADIGDAKKQAERRVVKMAMEWFDPIKGCRPGDLALDGLDWRLHDACRDLKNVEADNA